MIKVNYKILLGYLLLVMVLSFCIKKKTTTSATTSTVNQTTTSTTTITPTFTASQTGTGNPNITGQTVTGTTTLTNPATQNSSLLVDGVGWSMATCVSTNSITLKSINGSTEVTLNFLFPPTTGSYSIAASPGAQVCLMTVLNAPNQPAGIMWYAKTGIVSINTTTSAIEATFSGVLCTQQNFNFPTVGVTGTLTCN